MPESRMAKVNHKTFGHNCKYVHLLVYHYNVCLSLITGLIMYRHRTDHMILVNSGVFSVYSSVHPCYLLAVAIMRVIELNRHNFLFSLLFC